jgi:hypothetical protein
MENDITKMVNFIFQYYDMKLEIIEIGESNTECRDWCWHTICSPADHIRFRKSGTAHFDGKNLTINVINYDYWN